jgi:(p)ppGpp synthase/HD superfamily hydrolase
MRHIDLEKRVRIQWNSRQEHYYPVGLQIMTFNVRGAFASVAQVIAEVGGNLERIETPEHKDAHPYTSDAYIRIRLNIRDANQLQDIIEKLKKLPLVREVHRVIF